MTYSTLRTIQPFIRLIIKKKTKENYMESIEYILDKYFTTLGGKPYFRESASKRKRLMNFEDFKWSYRTVGQNLNDGVLMHQWNLLKGEDDE